MFTKSLHHKYYALTVSRSKYTFEVAINLDVCLFIWTRVFEPLTIFSAHKLTLTGSVKDYKPSGPSDIPLVVYCFFLINPFRDP